MQPETPPAPSLIARSDGRDERGRFAAGNVAALTTGEHSEQVRRDVLQSEQAQEALAERRALIEADLGGPDALSTIHRDVVRRYAELEAMATHFGTRLMAKKPTTSADRVRQMLSAYLSVVDRQHRHAALLGLERKQKRAPSVQELLGDLREERRS